jgi:predicted MFS family arabinose efflux permease
MLIAISLIPMVVVEVPVGHLLGNRDNAHHWQHNHVGMAGFGILALTAALVPFVESNEFVVWALLLFTMRIGAALVEIVAETYFFSIAGSDTEKAALFRALYPVSFIVGPLCASVAMSLAGYSALFFFLSCISLFGAYLASEFRDVRVKG